MKFHLKAPEGLPWRRLFVERSSTVPLACVRPALACFSQALRFG